MIRPHVGAALQETGRAIRLPAAIRIGDGTPDYGDKPALKGKGTYTITLPDPFQQTDHLRLSRRYGCTPVVRHQRSVGAASMPDAESNIVVIQT